MSTVDFKPCGHEPAQPDICAICRSCANNPKLSGKVGKRFNGVKKSLDLLPCVYRGGPTGETRPCKSCGTKEVSVKLQACEKHGACSVDRAVTDEQGKPIQTCRLCDDRVALAHKTQLPVHFRNTARIDPPKPLELFPMRRRAIVTVAVGQKAQEQLAIARPGMEAYAKRLDADFVVLEQSNHPQWGMAAKFSIPDTLRFYERVVYLDADVIVRPGAVNLFEACEPDELGAYNDWPEALSNHASFAVEFRNFREQMGFEVGPFSPVPWYVNTGIMVLSQQHREILNTPTIPIPMLHCGEQHWWVARMLEAGTKIKRLPRECNWQWWTDPGFARRAVPDNAILHFSGMANKGHEFRCAQMRKWSS